MSGAPRALAVYAGPRALRRLREQGLRPQDVVAVPAAAAGPRALVLNILDQYLFGHWLQRGEHPVHLLGASIGAWRMAAACLDDPARALAQMAQHYIGLRYLLPDGRAPLPRHASEGFGARLAASLGGHEERMLAHARYRLHIFTSRGRHPLLLAPGRWRASLGYLAAFASNALSRPALGYWLERAVFSDPREPLPMPLHDFRTRTLALSRDNLLPSILASCSIPFWFDAVTRIPGAPPGAYWDGGVTDYQLRLPYASIGDPLVLYPHVQRSVIPGWADQALRHRHRATAHLDNVVVLAPEPEWVHRCLPGGRLPDRSDFRQRDHAARIAGWRRAVAEGERLRDEFAGLVERGSGIEARPL